MSGFAQDVWAAWQAGRARAGVARAAVEHAAGVAAEPPPLVAVAAALPDAAAIPPREWLYGTRLVRRFVSVLIAPGGVGKSALALGQAVALASGRPILGERVHHSVPVWVLNLEDPLDETQRRLAALMRLHDIRREALAGRLFLHSGRCRRVTMAAVGEDASVRHPDRDAIVSAALAAGIGLIVVDPFVKSHSIDENSNGQVDAAATAWAEVAEITGAAVLLVHHVRKGAAADVEAARGAKALTDAARSAALLAPMTAEEAERLGVADRDRWRHVRLDDAKANLAPRLGAGSAETALWYVLQTVALGNGTPAYPSGDHVAAIAPWHPHVVTAPLGDRPGAATGWRARGGAARRDGAAADAPRARHGAPSARAMPAAHVFDAHGADRAGAGTVSLPRATPVPRAFEPPDAGVATYGAASPPSVVAVPRAFDAHGADVAMDAAQLPPRALPTSRAFSHGADMATYGAVLPPSAMPASRALDAHGADVAMDAAQLPPRAMPALRALDAHGADMATHQAEPPPSAMPTSRAFDAHGADVAMDTAQLPPRAMPALRALDAHGADVATHRAEPPQCAMPASRALNAHGANVSIDGGADVAMDAAQLPPRAMPALRALDAHGADVATHRAEPPQCAMPASRALNAHGANVSIDGAVLSPPGATPTPPTSDTSDADIPPDAAPPPSVIPRSRDIRAHGAAVSTDTVPLPPSAIRASRDIRAESANVSPNTAPPPPRATPAPRTPKSRGAAVASHGAVTPPRAMPASRGPRARGANAGAQSHVGKSAPPPLWGTVLASIPPLDPQAVRAALARIAAGPGDGLAWSLQRGGPPRRDSVDRWVGRVLVEACALTDSEASAVALAWLRLGVLAECPYRDPVQRKRRLGVRVRDAERAFA